MITQFKAGDRVYILDETGKNVIGFGVYEGDFRHPLGFFNARIKMDDGSIIWGCECWWGAEQDYLRGAA